MKKEMNRRDFFKFSAIAGLGLLANSCNKETPVEPPTPVTLTLRYINHTQGSYGTKTVNTESGSNVIVKPRDISGGQVDEQRVAVREEDFGKLVVFSKTGQASFSAPNQDTTYEVYGFNTGSAADYDLMDEQEANLHLGKSEYNVYRRDFDGLTGSEDLWANVFTQLNDALKHSWATYGQINRQPDATTGDFSYGYGITPGGPDGGSPGWHTDDRIVVFPGADDISIVSAGLAETFELICKVDDIGGSDSRNTICHWGSDKLNNIGRDLFAYVFAKQ